MAFFQSFFPWLGGAGVAIGGGGDIKAAAANGDVGIPEKSENPAEAGELTGVEGIWRGSSTIGMTHVSAETLSDLGSGEKGGAIVADLEFVEYRMASMSSPSDPSSSERRFRQLVLASNRVDADSLNDRQSLPVFRLRYLLDLWIQLIPGRRMNSSMLSLRTSMSHFWPLCLEKAHRSEANHAETAARPNEVKAVRTDVTVAVTLSCALG
jgi:hypothetical protein